MRYYLLLFTLMLLVAACNNNINGNQANNSADSISAFAKARQGFKTKIVRRSVDGTKPEKPPAGVLNLVQYPSNIGNMAAYVSPVPQDGRLHPAIIWIIGGFGNSLEDTWTPTDPGNDQTASALWKAGITVMYPSLRGGNMNPGSDETFYGEIDDIIAAGKYLAKLPGVDPKRIYLGGHSTGGTKTLLAAEASDIFRATFSVSGVSGAHVYGLDNITFDTSNIDEFYMRMPILWLSSIKKPVFLFDGSIESNASEMHKLNDSAKAQNITLAQFYEIKNANHFTICLPLCKIIAQKVLADTAGNKCNIHFDEAILNQDFDKLNGGGK